jgi:hypothetical protein
VVPRIIGDEGKNRASRTHAVDRHLTNAFCSDRRGEVSWRFFSCARISITRQEQYDDRLFLHLTLDLSQV